MVSDGVMDCVSVSWEGGLEGELETGLLCWDVGLLGSSVGESGLDAVRG